MDSHLCAPAPQDGKLCGTPFGVDVVGITQLVALIGALVGGVVARQRKEEVERLNEQLRKINLQLKKKLKTVPGNSAKGSQLARQTRAIFRCGGVLAF